MGVEYLPNPALQLEILAAPAKAYAKRLVIVSGGSFGSPLILERSGIGSTAVLEKYGIQQVVDLPGVGERCQGKLLKILT